MEKKLAIIKVTKASIAVAPNKNMEGYLLQKSSL